jgi:hypothetical protein
MPIVYVLTNEAMPGLVKIGMTDDANPDSRVSQLYSTGVPLPFDVEYACRVDNALEVERSLHIAFGPQRVNPRREFFRIDPSQAIAFLRLLDRPDATSELAHEVEQDPVSQQALRDARARRPNLNFREMGIPVGAVLAADANPDITLTVTSDKKVRIGDQPEELFFTAATREALGLDYNVRPAPLWRYNGRLLSELYEETYLLSEG